MLGMLIAGGVGLLLGMWVGKHPDDARAYGEGLWARISKAARWIVSKVKGSPPAAGG